MTERITLRRICPRTAFSSINVREVWQSREILFFLAWRDIVVRYKQTAIGIAWAVLRPFMTMVVLTVVFSRLGRFPSNGASYAVMTFTALLPWQFFSSSLSQGSNSVVAAANMIQKIYFPRLIIPISTTLSCTVDFFLSFLVLIGLMLWCGVSFRLHIVLLPLFFVLAAIIAMGISFWLGALNVKYRDVKHVVPFFVSMGLYVCPVGFMSSIIPEQWRLLYSLNPMVGVIDGFRWCILGPDFEPYWIAFWLSAVVAIVVFVSGAYYFRYAERTFADVI
ncbi:ABC transporter permease [Verrucomicrobiota bacterium]